MNLTDRDHWALRWAARFERAAISCRTDASSRTLVEAAPGYELAARQLRESVQTRPSADEQPDPIIDDHERSTAEFGDWCIAELFGHRRVAGYVREVTIAGDGWLRLDVPGLDGAVGRTQFYRPAAVYGLHPVSEEVARAAAARFRHGPVSRWKLAATAGERSLDDDEELDGGHF